MKLILQSVGTVGCETVINRGLCLKLKSVSDFQHHQYHNFKEAHLSLKADIKTVSNYN
jgi:hypothetical protein